jgi:type I restriction enzyme R subunit
VITEADTCRKYVLPRLVEAGWDTAPHSFTEQKTFTDGRIVVAGNRTKRRPQKRADYLLRFARDYMIAVVEAKSAYKSAGDGLQQAKEYAEILDLQFAYSTNGQSIIEFNYLTGFETEVESLPSPAELWARLVDAGVVDDSVSDQLLTPFHHVPGYSPRYYQEIAVNRAVGAILRGQQRVLLTMATGTGKTIVAFQISWKLWTSRWTRGGAHRRPRILYLADRNVLVDDPKDKAFAPFGEARARIESANITKSREMYFATYQAIAKDERRPGLYKEYDPEFFDLVIVDECHRGSAGDESSWREILEYFKGAFQLGMTATPLRDETRDTYRYFGNPLYQYSLRQGIEDGFLAPYKVHRVVTDRDAAGWRPEPDEADRYGRHIPDKLYATPQFEREVSFKARTQAIAANLAEFMKSDDRWAKTIVFCVDQEHADDMRRAIGNANADIVRSNPGYVARITADEGDLGRTLLSRFQELEEKTPVVVTTSQLLTTGVDIPTCKNVVIARMINSLVEFKQIIGRGTRVRDDYDKLFFNIIDYTGSATAMFADPEFDGFPALVTQEEMDEWGKTIEGSEEVLEEEPLEEDDEPLGGQASLANDDEGQLRKYYVDGGTVEIVATVVYELGLDGKRLKAVRYADYTGEKVRTLYPSAADLKRRWGEPKLRSEIVEALADRGIDFDQLAAATGETDVDPFDLLCHVAFNTPMKSRRERADGVKKSQFVLGFRPQAREILLELLEKYAELGWAQFTVPDVLKIPPLSGHGNVVEIASLFGGAAELRVAVESLQRELYAVA